MKAGFFGENEVLDTVLQLNFPSILNIILVSEFIFNLLSIDIQKNRGSDNMVWNP